MRAIGRVRLVGRNWNMIDGVGMGVPRGHKDVPTLLGCKKCLLAQNQIRQASYRQRKFLSDQMNSWIRPSKVA